MNSVKKLVGVAILLQAMALVCLGGAVADWDTTNASFVQATQTDYYGTGAAPSYFFPGITTGVLEIDNSYDETAAQLPYPDISGLIKPRPHSRSEGKCPHENKHCDDT